MEKQKYLQYWQEINTSNDTFINTSKVIKWIQNLINSEDRTLNEKALAQKNKNHKINPKSNKDKSEQIIDNPKIIQNQKQLKKVNNLQQKQQTLQKQDNRISVSKNQMTQEVILGYILKYIQTDQYKIIPKPLQKIQIETQQQKHDKNKQSKLSPIKRKQNKHEKKEVQEKKYDETIISLSYEESIFFYYWLVKTFQNDQELLKQPLLKAQIQGQAGQMKKNQELDGEENQINSIREQYNSYKPKFIMQLTQRQLIDLNQESFVGLKKHEPKLKLLFKHYAKLSHKFSKKVFTFDQANVLQQMINLHQWMLFSRDWSILNAKTISQNWEIGKLNRQILMEVFFKNSFYRKQMSFQLFERALISISSKMYQDCDLNHFKPIELLMSFLSIKNEDKFLNNLKQKKINYIQGDLMSCFKDKNRDVISKVKIIKKIGNHIFQRSKSEFIRTERQTSVQNSLHKNLKNKIQKEPNYLQNQFNQQITHSKLINPQKSIDSYHAKINNSAVNFSKVFSDKNYSTNRKSAPQIGIHLPSIQKNKFFQKLPTNNHLNTFKQYIKQQVPQSSSVLRNKITGYHKIHDLNNQNDSYKIKTQNKINHQKVNRLIRNKLENISIVENQKFTSIN